MTSRRRGLPLLPIVTMGVLVLAIAALVVSRNGSSSKDASSNVHERTTMQGTEGSRRDAVEFGTVDVGGKALSSFDDSASDPAVGKPAPTIVGQAPSGAASEITPDGTARLVVFLAHWCPHCNREAPRLASYLERQGIPKDVTITLVLTGSRSDAPNWPPSQWISKVGLAKLPRVMDDEDGRIAKAFGLASYPYIVSLDPGGIVVSRASGEQRDGFFAHAVERLAGTPA